MTSPPTSDPRTRDDQPASDPEDAMTGQPTSDPEDGR